MPDQMLRYRAASWFVRTVAPELSMGLHTQEEVVDMTQSDAKKQTGKRVDDLLGSVIEGELISETDEINNGVIVDHVTGEITETSPIDEYDDLRLAIKECETTSDLARLMNEMSASEKTNLAEILSAKQSNLKHVHTT